MPSLWGSKSGEESAPTANEGQESHQESSRPSGGPEPDERTRLLPQHQRHDGYLDPDDPAVSPYNLWTVRALRYLSVLFLVITFLWWVLLLVSIFVSPPGMHSRGSGFFDFSFSTLTIGNLLVAILFFAVPSKPMELGSVVIAIFLLVDLIIIAAVSKLRLEEGWVGTTSVIWSTLIAFYTVITNRVVAWGKKEEEERLTGRQETRRSLGEWLAVFTATLIQVILVLVVILLTATLIVRARDAGVAAPGERYLVDGDKYALHVACVGNDTYDKKGKRLPTVFVEGGEQPVEDTMLGWVHNAYTNGTINRYCFYDRPGIAFSDNAPSPHSAGMTSDAISDALVSAGELGPWVLVSAGVGGIYSRIFSSRHKAEVQGIMLIDALHEDLLSGLANPSKGFLLWLRGIISPLGWDRLFGAIVNGRTPEDRVYGKSAYQTGKFIKAKLQESLVADSLTKSEVSQARHIQNDQTPVVVVSSGIKTRNDQEWEKKQRLLTKITNKLVSWDIVNGAPHEVWHTYEGRSILEKRVGELLKAS